MELIQNLKTCLLSCHNFFIKMMQHLKKYWPQYLTVGIMLVAIYVFFVNDTNARARIGDYLSGFAGALAFIWLIAGFNLQREELSEQRKEIKRMSESSALNHVKISLDIAIIDLKGREYHNYTINDLLDVLPNKLERFCQDINIIYETKDHITIKELCDDYKKVFKACERFTHNVANISQYYLMSTEDFKSTETNEFEFLCSNEDKIKTILYIQDYFYIVQKFSKILENAHICEHSILAAKKCIDNNGTSDHEFLQDEIVYHETNNLKLPAILEHYKKSNSSTAA